MGNGVAFGARAAFGVMAAGWLLPLAAEAACLAETVELRSPNGALARFSVEVADDEAERAQGLMNRPALAKSAGMLFVYDHPRHAFFWMKNTLIPLDMIFADATGKVTVVHDRAVPLDETAIDGGEGVAYVLEINGGLAGALGIVPGSVLQSPLIAQDTAAWPCGE